MKKQKPSIKVHVKVKKKLDDYKISPSESYSDVIKRLLNNTQKEKKV